MSFSTELKVSSLMMDTDAPFSDSISRGRPFTVTESMIGLDREMTENMVYDDVESVDVDELMTK